MHGAVGRAIQPAGPLYSGSSRLERRLAGTIARPTWLRNTLQQFRRRPLAELAGFLSTLAAIDRSFRDGLYDFRLDLHEVSGPGSSEAERLAAPSNGTVVQEQLGLRLEDRVERPSMN